MVLRDMCRGYSLRMNESCRKMVALMRKSNENGKSVRGLLRKLQKSSDDCANAPKTRIDTEYNWDGVNPLPQNRGIEPPAVPSSHWVAGMRPGELPCSGMARPGARVRAVCRDERRRFDRLERSQRSVPRRAREGLAERTEQEQLLGGVRCGTDLAGRSVHACFASSARPRRALRGTLRFLAVRADCSGDARPIGWHRQVRQVRQDIRVR